MIMLIHAILTAEMSEKRGLVRQEHLVQQEQGPVPAPDPPACAEPCSGQQQEHGGGVQALHEVRPRTAQYGRTDH